MTIYTQADADAAKAKLALDTQALADDQQAVITAQAGVTSAEQAVTDAEAALAVAQQNLAAEQAALSSANDAVTAVQADMAAQQAIIDAYAAQPAPIVVPPATDYIMPDLPAFPQGPFTKHSTIKVSATNNKIYLPNPVEFGGNYICINHTDSTVVLQQLEIAQALVDAEGGSLFYSGSMCGGAGAHYGIVGCTKGRPGRPFIRHCGVWGPIVIEDLTDIYDPTPNTHTGDIATGAQFGNKAAGEALESVHIMRALVQSIYDSWPSTSYWNGDGITAERTLKTLQVDHCTTITAPDACIDSKARHNIFGNLYAKDSREAPKVWDDFTANSIVSINPHTQGGIGGSSGLRCMGAPARHYDASTMQPVGVVNQLWHESPTAPMARIENGPFELHIKQGRSDAPKLVYTTNGGSLHPNSTWNGSAFPKALIQAG